MKNFSALLNGSFNFSNITETYACNCACGVLADNFTFGAINLVLVTVVFYLWNKYIYTARHGFDKLDTMKEKDYAFYIIDKILLALFFLNLASVFFALAIKCGLPYPLVFGL